MSIVIVMGFVETTGSAEGKLVAGTESFATAMSFATKHSRMHDECETSGLPFDLWQPAPTACRGLLIRARMAPRRWVAVSIDEFT
jgi:hypothetical protein